MTLFTNQSATEEKKASFAIDLNTSNEFRNSSIIIDDTVENCEVRETNSVNGSNPIFPMTDDAIGDSIQPISISEWDYSNFQETKFSMDCTVVSLPSQDDSTDSNNDSFDTIHLDSSLNYQFDWSDDARMSLKKCLYEIPYTIQQEDDMLIDNDYTDGFDNIDSEMTRPSDMALNSEDAKSLSIWMKSSETTDIWI